MRIDLIPTGDNPPESLNVVIEVPAGGEPVKYEFDKESGALFVDRILHTPMRYPANYGFIPHTLSPDGDPLDALVLTREPLHPGVLIAFRPIGYLRMLDKGEQDDKVIGVPTDKVDPTYSNIRDLADLPLIERQRIEAFFRIYKDLPAGRNPVVLNGYGNAAEAKVLITEALQRFEKKTP